MTTHFITAELPLEDNAQTMQAAILAELQKHGDPLRWAMTEVNPETQTFKLEAVVTRETNG